MNSYKLHRIFLGACLTSAFMAIQLHSEDVVADVITEENKIQNNSEGIKLTASIENQLTSDELDTLETEKAFRFAQETEILQNLNAQVSDLLDVVMSTIKYLSDQMNSKKLWVKNPGKVRAWFEQSKLLIVDVRAVYQKSPIEKSVMECFQKIIFEVMNRIEIAMQSRFTKLPDMTIASFTFRRTMNEPTIDNLAEAAQILGLRSQNLQAQADLVAYNTVQKTYHALNRLNKKYNLTSHAQNACLAALGVGALIYFLPEDYAKTYHLAWIKENIVDKFVHTVLGEIKPVYDANKTEIGSKFSGGFFGLVSNLSQSPTIQGIKTFAELLGVIITLRLNWDRFKELSPMPSISKAIYKQINKIKSAITGTSIQSGAQKEIVNDLTLDNELFAKLQGQYKDIYVTFDFFKNVKRYILAGIKPPKALLLTGPSGCGKSYIIKALAGSVQDYYKKNNMPEDFGLIFVSPEMVKKEGLANIFFYALYKAPCILFFDEIHMLALQAGMSQGALTEFLTLLDDLALNQDPNTQIIVIGATNRPDLLDTALKRSGRFTVVPCLMPTFEQRKHMFMVKCKKSLALEGIDFDLLAHLTEGCSFADINKVFETAEYYAQKTGINQQHLYRALNDVVRKIKTGFNLSETEGRRIAIHQSAVSLAYLALKPENINFESVTIQSYEKMIQEKYDWQIKAENIDIKKMHKPKYGMTFIWHDNEVLQSYDIDTKVKLCKIQLAGVVAQRLLLGSEAYCKRDRRRAYAKACEIILRGLSMKDLSKKQQEEIKDQALALVKKCEDEMGELIEQHKDQLMNLAQLLQEKLMLTHDEVAAVLQL